MYGQIVSGNGTASLEEWGSAMKNFMDNNKFVPSPIKMKLSPIINLVFTPAAARINHEDGTPLNVTNVSLKLLTGYKRFVQTCGYYSYCDLYR